MNKIKQQRAKALIARDETMFKQKFVDFQTLTVYKNAVATQKSVIAQK